MLNRSAAALVLASTLLSGCAGSDDTSSLGASSASTPVATATATASAAEAAPTSQAPASPSAPAVREVSVTYTGGRIAGTSGREEIRLGEQVVLRFVSDVAEEIHVHGYDLETALPAGQPAEIALTADIPGVFEVELHGSGEVLYQLRVS